MVMTSTRVGLKPIYVTSNPKGVETGFSNKDIAHWGVQQVYFSFDGMTPRKPQNSPPLKAFPVIYQAWY